MNPLLSRVFDLSICCFLTEAYGRMQNGCISAAKKGFLSSIAGKKKALVYLLTT